MEKDDFDSCQKDDSCHSSNSDPWVYKMATFSSGSFDISSTL